MLDFTYPNGYTMTSTEANQRETISIFELGRLWSLWDLMQVIDGKSVLDGIAWLSNIRVKFQKEMPKPQIFSAEAHRLRAGDLERLINALDNAGLRISANNAREVKEGFDGATEEANGERILKDVPFEKFMYYSDSVLRLAGDEAKTKILLSVNAPVVNAFDDSVPIFGDDVATKFPSIKYDVTEASKCLTLGRSTASAFHLLRCLEAAIRAVARSLNIADPIKGAQRNWGNALSEILKELDRRWPKATRISGDAVLFERWHTDFSLLQNPYRNSTMHLETTYTEEDAEHLFITVRKIMQSIAARLDENGLPLA
jgi:HEPN domain-containing protein